MGTDEILQSECGNSLNSWSIPLAGAFKCVLNFLSCDGGPYMLFNFFITIVFHTNSLGVFVILFQVVPYCFLAYLSHFFVGIVCNKTVFFHLAFNKKFFLFF